MNAAPEPLPNDVAALRAMLAAAWAERDAERAEKAQLAAECDQLASQNDRLRHLIRQLQRLRFGRRSEQLDPDQLALALEDVEQAVAEIEAQQEKADPALKRTRAETRRVGRGALPEHLPRVEIVIEPENTACRCCGGAMQVIGEDRSSRLDVLPAQYRGLITRPPRRHPGAVWGPQPPPPKIPLPYLPGRGGAGRGAGTVDRGRFADRAAGCAGAGGEICRSLPLVSPIPNSGAAGYRDRSLDPGLLGRLCGSRNQAAMAIDARGAAALDQAVCRRDDRSGARPGSRPNQDGLFLGACP